MKKVMLILTVLLFFVISGCGSGKAPAKQEDHVYHSELSVQECYLCGGGIEEIAPFYWGQDNLALISLNTFEIRPVEINRYDRLTRQMIEEYAGTISFGGGGSQDGGFSAELMLDYDRGYAEGSLHFYNDGTLDPERAASFLCADCLNRIIPQELEQCFGVGVIHLATKEIRVFEECVTGFGLGDFHVDCNLMGGSGRGSRWLDLLAFYCPVRYEKES